MSWLHNETNGFIKKLVTDNNGKSSYIVSDIILNGHFKKINEQDGVFDTSNIEGEAFKFTIKEIVDVAGGDRLIIENGKYSGEYSIQSIKFGDGLILKTTKILVVKQ